MAGLHGESRLGGGTTVKSVCHCRRDEHRREELNTTLTDVLLLSQI